MKRLLTLLLFFNTMLLLLQAQPMHQIKGTVIDKNSRQPLEFINVMIIGLNKGSVTNAEGRFTIEQVPPGIYRLQASAIGYKSVTTSEYILSTKNLNIPIEMEENLTELEGVTITASPFRCDVESPVSLRIIGIQEIEKSPGANRDISRIVQSYPGVAFSPIGYRNDLIVRGGAPSENRFYLDGVEIPNINHFSTQGASGGPVGILNADLIREVNFYTGAFPADKGNALSSVLDFKLRDGDMERNSLKATLGASEVSLASNGHIGKKTSYLVSVRQSYLQFLFDMLDLPFLPTFTDAQFKLKTRFNEQNELTVLGLGGIDNMRLNTKADSEDNEYILSYLPKIKQETFTVGAVYRHYAGAHVQSAVVSHSYLNNRNTKYRRNDESHPDNLMLRLRSTEQETKLRLENSTTFRNWKINLGINLDYSQYTNTTFQRVYTNQPQTFDYHTYLGILRWGLFGTINYTSMDDRFTASLGLRADANDYSSTMKNLSDQLSPRLSLSYQLADHWFASGNAGLYYQLPAYTALGFKNNNGTFANKYNLRYMKVSEGSLGISWRKGDTFENVPDSYRMGIEIMLGIKPCKWFQWDINATWSKNRIQDFVESLPGYHYNDDGSSTSLPTIQIKHKDTHIAFSPDFLLNNRFSFNYKGFEAALQSQFVSKQYMTNAEVEELTLDKYFVSNLNLAYSFRPKKVLKEVTIGFTVYNLFNEKYENNGWASSDYTDTLENRRNYAGYAAQAGTNVMGHVSFRF